MAYILFAFALFCASVAVHIVYCRRTKTPGLQARPFLVISFFFIAVYAAGVYFTGQGHALSPDSFWGLPFKLASALIFILLVPTYLMFYALTQLMSPSKKILMSIHRRGSLSYKDILAHIEEEDFINTRLNDLCTSGCAVKVNGRYFLTPEGQKIATALDLTQRLLGRGIGG